MQNDWAKQKAHKYTLQLSESQEQALMYTFPVMEGCVYQVYVSRQLLA